MQEIIVDFMTCRMSNLPSVQDVLLARDFTAFGFRGGNVA